MWPNQFWSAVYSTQWATWAHYEGISALFTSPKKTHIKPITQGVLIIQLFGPNTIKWIEENSWSPSGSQPQNSNGWIQPTRGSHKVWNKTDKGWAVYLLVEPTPCTILLKKRRATAPIFSNVTRAIRMPFSSYSNTTSSFQLYTPPETMNSGSVHAADLCTIAQRLLAATETCWKWESMVEN